jgi:trk system potassium uptake protein TrkA
MEIIVIGCGRLGSTLAARLEKAGHTVSVIDANPSSYANLPPNFNGRFHEGDALMQDVLVRAGIQHAQGLAVVTNSDALNVAIAHVGRTVYKIPNVVARNYDPRCRVLFEEMDLQVISSTSWGAQRIEEILFDSDVRSVFSAGNGEIEIYEFVVPALWQGKKVSELLASNECVAVSITRGGKAMLPDADMILIEGDILNVSASFEGINDLRHKLGVEEGI